MEISEKGDQHNIEVKSMVVNAREKPEAGIDEGMSVGIEGPV